MRKALLYIFLIQSFTVLPCFWDYDTIEMERQDFPGVVELIAGKFLRHSPEYHYWRIKDREVKLQKYPDSLGLYDDMAVSYSKIGNQKKAIEIILKKDSLQHGHYETYANLGTFYLHDGQYEKGIEYIDKAIEINPNAHFGREIYQKYVAEYVLSKSEKGKVSLPLQEQYYHSPDRMISEKRIKGFYDFLLEKHKIQANRIKNNSKVDTVAVKAIEGVLGMMKFGNHQSPILLEVLGDLLMQDNWNKAGRNLAARAYLKASHEVDDKHSKDAYKRKALFALYHQRRNGKGNQSFSFEDFEHQFNVELKEGENFYKEIRNNELKWILNESDPEKVFAKNYYNKQDIKFDSLYYNATGRNDQLNKLSYVRKKNDPKISQKASTKMNFHQPDSIVVQQIDSIFETRKNGKESLLNDHQNQESNEEEPSNDRDFMKLIYLLVALMTLILLIFGRRFFKTK